MTGTNCEVRLRRAKDLTSNDVIRLLAPPRRISGRGETRWDDIAGWREVLGVFTNASDLYAQFDPAAGDELDQFAYEAFHRVLDAYVLVQVLLHEASKDEVEDALLILYRHDLVEVQSLPAWEDNDPPTPNTRPRKAGKAVT